MDDILLKKFINLSNIIINDKGSLNLMMLVGKETPFTEDRWDFLISAKWLDEDNSKNINYLMKKMLVAQITPQDIRHINRIVPLKKNSEFVTKINSAVSSEGRPFFLDNCIFNDIRLDGIVITSKK